MTSRPRGLAALALTDPDRAREIRSKGGKAKKARHYDDPEAAKAAINGRWKKAVDADPILSNKDA